MAFSESVKLSVKQKADFTCCWCKNRQNKVEVHHIIPQAEGGPNDGDNAAPLCGSCHDLYGGNPDLRKEIRLRRDYWYEQCSKKLNLSGEQSTNQQKFGSNQPLTISIISYHAKPGAWNQGDPLSPFEFEIKLDLVNHTYRPIILTSFKISALEVPHEKLNQSPPHSTLLLVENNKKSSITFPYQIAGEYFGLFEYQIKIPLNDQERLNFVPDSDVFQNYTIKLDYEYYDIARSTYTASIVVQGTFQEFKDVWQEVWNSYQDIKRKSRLPDPDLQKRPSRWRKFNN